MTPVNAVVFSKPTTIIIKNNNLAQNLVEFHCQISLEKAINAIAVSKKNRNGVTECFYFYYFSICLPTISNKFFIYNNKLDIKVNLAAMDLRI